MVYYLGIAVYYMTMVFGNRECMFAEKSQLTILHNVVAKHLTSITKLLGVLIILGR